ncbi:MAG: arsenic efflux protein [Bacteroidetes bacterium]|nr:arsenic efflux protein [Bacteroidota bacterium]
MNINVNELIIFTLKNSLMITVFVLFMMVIIEYINVQTRNIWSEKLINSPFLQLILAALLGITPGCLGAFTVVSLYTHRMLNLGALVTVMIATSGDESFVMFAMFPGKALLLHFLLFVVAILAGYLVNLFNKSRPLNSPLGFKIHESDYCKCFTIDIIIPQLKRITFERTLLLLFTLVFGLLLGLGIVGSDVWDWERITFMTGTVIMLFVFITVPDHFIHEHLYGHIVKKHLIRIFLWTWGAFVVLYFIQSSLELTNLVENNTWIIFIIAVLVGIIPESGPHLIFVTMFSQGLLPFSILFANSIVQDGHGMLPLLAESRKDFIKVKLINMLAAFVVGSMLLLFGV